MGGGGGGRRGQARSSRREGMVDKSYPRVAALLRIKRGDCALDDCTLLFSRARSPLRFVSRRQLAD